MKGDFSRVTFDPQKHYSRVLLQQGRVQTDADFNEQADISVHLLRRLAADLIGPHGGPGNGFRVEPASDADGDPIERDFVLQRGRYYVAGILCENASPESCPPEDEPPLLYTSQPYWTPPLLEAGENYFVYLDVWERHVTYLQDDLIREVALGGPDTATRTQVVWQVKVLTPEDEEWDPGPELCSQLFRRLRRRSGCLAARARVDEESTEPCIISPEARYRGAENQLYRVEIHAGSASPDGATFKWSRDNGALVYPLETLKGNTATVEHLGRDDRQGLGIGDWVEVVDDASELAGEPGPLLKVVAVNSQDRRVTVEAPEGVDLPVYDEEDTDQSRLLRRWDHRATKSTALTGGAIPVVESEWADLEDGVQVLFSGGDGHDYRPGDYWLIPARVATGDIEWPKREDDSGESVPITLAPRGIKHHYAPLALVSVDANGVAGIAGDCRCTFDPLCSPAEPSPQPPAPPPGPEDNQFPVEEIDGIGEQFAERLRAAGIQFANQVAAMNPPQLAAILQTTESRATGIIRNARLLIGGS